MGQHVGLSGAHDDDAAPDPGSPAYDPWWRHECDDDEDEAAESHETLGSRRPGFIRPKAKRAGAIVGLDG